MRLAQDEIREGEAYMRARNYDGALRKFRTALILDPDDGSLAHRIESAEKSKAIDDQPR